MSLTREQHDQVMRILCDRRLKSARDASERREDVYRRFPAVKVCQEKLNALMVEKAAAVIRGDSQGADRTEAKIGRLEAEKRELLKTNRIPVDFAFRIPFCAACGDKGFLEDGTKCTCAKQLEARLLEQESGLPRLLARENFETFDLEVYDDVNPVAELSRSENITQRDWVRSRLLPEAMRFVNSFKPGNGQNILMTGGAGTGKTFLSNCIAKALNDRYSVTYTTAADLTDSMYRESFSKEDTPPSSGISARVRSCDLLIIDDLGTEFSSAFSNSRLFSTISHRLTERSSTIISTNLTLNQISTVYGDRMASRLAGEYILLPFYGNDLRLEKKRRQQRFT